MPKRIREEKRLTRAQLAENAGVTREYITMMEAGFRKNPSLKILQRLAKALNVPVADFLG